MEGCREPSHLPSPRCVSTALETARNSRPDRARRKFAAGLAKPEKPIAKNPEQGIDKNLAKRVRRVGPNLGPELPDTGKDCAGRLGIDESAKPNNDTLFRTVRNWSGLPPPLFKTGASNHSAILHAGFRPLCGRVMSAAYPAHCCALQQREYWITTLLAPILGPEVFRTQLSKRLGRMSSTTVSSIGPIGPDCAARHRWRQPLSASGTAYPMGSDHRQQ